MQQRRRGFAPHVVGVEQALAAGRQGPFLAGERGGVDAAEGEILLGGLVPGQGGGDGKVVRQAAVQVGMAGGHGYAGVLDNPAAHAGLAGQRTGSGVGKDVVEAFSAGVGRGHQLVGRGGVSFGELGLVGLGPAPCVEHAVGGDAVFEQIEFGRGRGRVVVVDDVQMLAADMAFSAAPVRRLLASQRGFFLGPAAAATVRVQDAPDIADRGLAGDDAMGGGQGRHVEVSGGDDQRMACLFGGIAQELGDCPGLGLAVNAVAVGGVRGVGGVGVGVEDVDDEWLVLELGVIVVGVIVAATLSGVGRVRLLVGRARWARHVGADAGVSNALADVPVAAPEGGRAAVEREADHVGFEQRPGRQDGQAGAHGAGKVELGMGQNGADVVLDGGEVVVGPQLLQTHNVGLGERRGNLAANLTQPRGAVLCEAVLEAPAVEREHVDLRGA